MCLSFFSAIGTPALIRSELSHRDSHPAGVDSERWKDGEGLEGAHNGVRSDDVVEVREPEASEQRNHHRAWEAGTMKVDRKARWKMFWAAGAAMALVAGMASTVPSAYAGGTIKVDDDKWISIGMGVRISFNGVENGAANGSALEQRLWGQQRSYLYQRRDP